MKLRRKPVDAAYEADRQRTYTVLTIDGGGMRGMIPGELGRVHVRGMAAKHAN